MALGATIYVFNIELADSDRGVYQPLQLRVARHPSESEEYFLTRILAYCLEYTEGISFSNGLFEPDEPTIAVRDLTGALNAFIVSKHSSSMRWIGAGLRTLQPNSGGAWNFRSRSRSGIFICRSVGIRFPAWSRGSRSAVHDVSREDCPSAFRRLRASSLNRDRVRPDSRAGAGTPGIGALPVIPVRDASRSPSGPAAASRSN